jgi:hypothetical protein
MSPPATPGSAETSEWSAHLNQQKVGPFTVSQLRLLVEAGELRPDDLVLPPNTDQWVPVSAVPELSATRPADEDQVPTRRQPPRTAGGFWRWYRTRPFLVVLIVCGLLALALVPILLLLLAMRQMQREAMAARDMARAAEMQAREVADMERERAEVALQEAQQALKKHRAELVAALPEKAPRGLLAVLNGGPLKPTEGDDELRKLLKERYNAALAAAKGMRERYRTGIGGDPTLLQLHNAVQKVITAELDLSDKPIDQVTVLEKNLAIAKELEEVANESGKAGNLSRGEMETFRYYRIEAEAQLFKARRNVQ